MIGNPLVKEVEKLVQSNIFEIRNKIINQDGSRLTFSLLRSNILSVFPKCLSKITKLSTASW